MKEPNEKTEVAWGTCCFCALDIESSVTEPCRVTVETATGKWQVWFCHAACFKGLLTDPPGFPGMVEPAHF